MARALAHACGHLRLRAAGDHQEVLRPTTLFGYAVTELARLVGL